MTGENLRRAVQNVAQKAHGKTRLSWGKVLLHALTAAWTCLIVCPTTPRPTNTKISRTSSKQSKQLWQAIANLLNWPYIIANGALLSTEMTVALLYVLALSGVPL